MHHEAFEAMKDFELNWVRTYFPESAEHTVLDVGSMDLGGGCHRDIFKDYWYTGLDIAPGNNVDVVVENPYNWKEINHIEYDIIISGQCLEHVEYPWLTFQEMNNVLTIGGICCITVPSRGPIHRYPVDCYRFLPDGMEALGKYVGWEVVDSDLQEDTWGTLRTIYSKPG